MARLCEAAALWVSPPHCCPQIIILKTIIEAKQWFSKTKGDDHEVRERDGVPQNQRSSINC